MYDIVLRWRDQASVAYARVRVSQKKPCTTSVMAVFSKHQSPFERISQQSTMPLSHDEKSRVKEYLSPFFEV